jgi:hypothetical protein
VRDLQGQIGLQSVSELLSSVGKSQQVLPYPVRVRVRARARARVRVRALAGASL